MENLDTLSLRWIIQKGLHEKAGHLIGSVITLQRYRGYLDDGVMRIDNKIFDKTFYESFDIQ